MSHAWDSTESMTMISTYQWKVEEKKNCSNKISQAVRQKTKQTAARQKINKLCQSEKHTWKIFNLNKLKNN